MGLKEHLFRGGSHGKNTVINVAQSVSSGPFFAQTGDRL